MPPNKNKHRPLRALFGVALALSLSLPLTPGLTQTPAFAAPGTPGIPANPTQVFIETFENGTGADVISLTNYTGTQGTTYTADTPWLNRVDCNNLILRYENPIWQNNDCANNVGVRHNVQRLADVLGQVSSGVIGSSSTATPVDGSTAQTRLNHAASAYTYQINMANDLTVFESSVLPVRLEAGRFYTSSIDVAELSCEYAGGVNNSRIDFTLTVDGNAYPLQDDPIRACTDSRVGYYTSPIIDGDPWGSGGEYVGAGTYYSDRSYLMPAGGAGETRLVVSNRTGSSQGNDFAYDNVELVDATPQLDKVFMPGVITSGESSVLTLTVTNTSELAEKRGWGFTDNLPTGLVIADNPVDPGTCDADVTAAPGTSAITISNGVLEEGQVSCTINVSVTSSSALGGTDPPAIYENCAANISNATGVNAPECAQLVINPPPYSALSIVKTADHEGLTADDEGTVVTYSFVVKNEGNTTLTNVTPEDTGFTGAGNIGPFTPGPVTLAPGASQLFTAEYTVQADDLLADSIENTAIASGLNPENERIESPESEWDIEIGLWGELVLTKTSDVTVITEDMIGETITYSFLVTNIGTATMTDVRPVDSQFNGSGTLGAFSPESAILPPGGSETFTAEYVVTEEDFRLENLTNTAYATGLEPDGEVEDSPPSTNEIPVEKISRLEIEKTSTTTTIDADSVGETITYEFLVTNTGNTILEQVTPVEVNFSGTGTLGDFTPGPVTLTPGESQVFTAEYTVTLEDVRSESLTNTAIATGVVPGSPPNTPPVESPPGDNTIVVNRVDGLSIEKFADTTVITSAGQEITYTFVVTNTGQTVLTDVRVNEIEFSGTGNLSGITPDAVTLQPGEAQTFTATYVVTEADVAAGDLVNTANASGVNPDGDMVDSPRTSVTVKGATSLASTGYSISMGVGIAFTIALLAAGALLLSRRKTEANA